MRNPNAVYGYSPNPNSASIGEYADAIDWTDPIEVEKATLRREAYHSKNDNISEIVAKMKSDGCSKEAIARAANKQRNLNRLNDYINEPEGLACVVVCLINIFIYMIEIGDSYEKRNRD